MSLRSSSKIFIIKLDGEPSRTPICCASMGIIILAPKLSILSVILSCRIITFKFSDVIIWLNVTFLLSGW